MNLGLVVAVSAIAVGAFTLAHRTMATVKNDLTSLHSVTVCLIATIGATITTVLSYLGTPTSLGLSTIAAVIGLEWGGQTLRGRLGTLPTPLSTRAGTPFNTISHTRMPSIPLP